MPSRLVHPSTVVGFVPRRVLSGIASAAAWLGVMAGFVFAPSTHRCFLRADERPASKGPVDFVREVRSILSDKCFTCHGPDAERREGDLRLDSKDGAASVIAPGKPDESELIRRLVTSNADERMPPADANKPLTVDQIDVLRRWVEQGAAWDEHWSYAPLIAPAVPELAPRDPAVIRNPIDAFVQSKLASEGIAPSPEAPREKLIRRVTLDLTGLPPTPEEVAAFLADDEPQAYERLVDRLLKSPHFGERMAWDWLDAARYADSNGYQGDRERTMWPWRDWVVKAFNENLPYDDFTVWQLAGDLLPDATMEQRLATGFCRNHMINGEGGRIPEENRVDYVMDMTETMGTVWLGATLNCARCHDHKFDPFTRRDYYQFFAYFNQTPVDGGGGDPQAAPAVASTTKAERDQMAAWESAIADRAKQLEERASQLAAAQPEWEKERIERLAASRWRPLEIVEARAERQELTTLDDRSVLAGGPLADNDAYTITARPDGELKRITGIRIEALRHESLTNNSLSRADSGNFVLTEFELHKAPAIAPEPPPGDSARDDSAPNEAIKETDSADAPPALKFASAVASFEQGDLKIASAFDGDPKTGWAVYEGRVVDREHEAVLRLAEPLVLEPGTTLHVTLRHDSPHVRHNLGRFRLSVTDADEPTLDGPVAALRAALQVVPADRSKEQADLLTREHQQSDEAYRRIAGERDATQNELNKLRAALPKVMVMQELEKPRPTFMLDRGLYNQPSDPVESGVPASLPPLADDAPANRLGLAQWLVSDQQPLTARVTVNRFWQQVFGVGLVKTTEDFGSQGEVPPHVDLLNWLAADFRTHGWDVKRLMRMIVTSHTYRQSSKLTGDAAERDPENRLLARGPRFRLPSWMLRDQALAASGLLVPKLGGPPVNGYQPAGVWEEATFGNKKYSQESGEALYRRSLYTFWRRIIAPTMFFDNASRQVCTVKPFRTNTPLHALLTQNDVTYVEASRALAQLALRDGHPDAAPADNASPRSDVDKVARDEARINFIFHRLLARPAGADERDILLGGLERSRGEFAADPESPAKLLAMGESPRDERLDAVEHAAWTALCLTLLNLDETLTKE